MKRSMHSVWRGSLTFGLVNIPVRLYHASREKEFAFKLLHKSDLSEIRYMRVCKHDGKEVPWSEVVKGVEVAGKTVIFSEEEFAKANPKRIKTLDIQDFVKEEEIDPIYYAVPYYLDPFSGSR